MISLARAFAFSEKTNKNAKPLKILWTCYPRIFDRYKHLSGWERIERLGHLSKEGNQVYLIAADFDKGYYERNPNMHLVSIPLRYIPLISSIMYGLALFLFLPFYLVKIRPDFVISDISTAPFLVWKPILSKSLRLKMTLDIRSTPVNPYGVRGKLAHLQFNLSVRLAREIFDGMTIVTPMMRSQICREFQINPNSVGILSNGISDDFLRSKKNHREGMQLRKKLGLSDRFIVITHGSLRMRIGGIEDVVKALALVKKDCPEIILFLLGHVSKQYSHLLEKAIKENDVEGNVLLHGPVDFHDVPRYISMGDVGLVSLPNIPTWRYQQPLKLLEYMAMGKTVIVSDSPAHRSIIENNKNGIYVPHVNPVELAQALKYAYYNRDRLEEWGEIGRQIVIRKYIWKRVNEDLIDYLRQVQNGEKRLK